MDCENDVERFHWAFGSPMPLYDGGRPEFPSQDRIDLRQQLNKEEYDELNDAIARRDIVGVADGIADLIYVLTGMALEFGIPLTEVWREVQKTNMAKVGGGRRDDGKILKPAGWKPPDIEAILRSFGAVLPPKQESDSERIVA